MIKVENLVNQFLSVQSLKVLPQGPFSEAVNQFVAKDDKQAMELFVSEHLSGQVKQMLGLDDDDEDLNNAMETYKQRVEQRMATAGSLGRMAQSERKRVLKPRPNEWDSDFDGNWEDEPGAWAYEDDMPSNTEASGSSRRPQPRDDEMLDLDDEETPAAKPKKTRATKATPVKKAAAGKKPPARRGRKPFEDSEEEEPPEEDVVMDSDEAEAPPPPKPAARTTRRGQNAKTTAAASKPAAAKKTTRGAAAAKTRQTKLNFSQGATQDKAVEISDDEISDDDAFEPAPVASRTRRR
jgi:double-strand break repair protein MRE11